MDCPQIQRLVRKQKWKGLCIQHSEAKGTSVVANRRFLAGEVVCDDHGRVVTASEGQEVSSCDCHPGKQTPGRLIRPSRKKANVTPKHYTFEMDGEERQVTLFLATRTITPDEVILIG